ncbi:MAG: bifunctional hydroxymethylpyrimidine kinase/phosphomethylpyrimidine kinase [Pyrinomonadaceae bacterium]
MSKSKQYVVMTIAGLDPSGGAGIIADVKTMMAFGCFPTAIVTALTFQNTTGVFGVRKQTAADVIGQIMPVVDDFRISAVKTGMLPNGAIISAIAELVRSKKLPAPVVDPVVVSTSGHRLISRAALVVLMRDLIPVARIVTPNIPEAELLSGLTIKSEDDRWAAAEKIGAMGARAVLVKGGHHHGRDALDILWEQGKRTDFRSPWIKTRSTHGTGCTLSAAIAAGLAHGKSMKVSVGEAKEYVHSAITNAPGLGKGNGPVDHAWQFRPSHK